MNANMLTIWSIVRLIIFMFIVPMCIGQLFKYILKKELRTLGITFYALAAIPMWIAFIAKAAGVHSTIVTYTAWPLLIIPLTYFIYHEIAKVLFAYNIALRPIFMIMVNMLMIFGNVSIYTPATFFLMRTWQGKSMLTSIAFPTILLIFLWMLKDTGEEDKKLSQKAAFWGLLALVNMFSGMCSEMGVVFGAGLVALLTLVLLHSSKRLTVLLGAFCSVIPNLVYVVLYKLM